MQLCWAHSVNEKFKEFTCIFKSKTIEPQSVVEEGSAIKPLLPYHDYLHCCTCFVCLLLHTKTALQR